MISVSKSRPVLGQNRSSQRFFQSLGNYLFKYQISGQNLKKRVSKRIDSLIFVCDTRRSAQKVKFRKSCIFLVFRGT